LSADERRAAGSARSAANLELCCATIPNPGEKVERATCARHVGKDRDHCPHHATAERVRQLGFHFDDGGTK
jgi:hypothetical protein